METLGKFIFSVGLAISSLFGFHQVNDSFVAGSSFTPVQASQFTLAGAGVTSSQTTIPLTSFKLPDPNKTPITMSMFGSIGYAVLEPQSSRIENVTFTGVIQNSNGTATLTGVSRGISFYTPYNASTTLALSHAGGAYLILTNSAAFYGKEFLFANSVSTSTAPLIFSSTTPPRYDFNPQFNIVSTTTMASVGYVNDVAFGTTPIGVSAGGTGQITLPLNMFLVGNGTSPVTSTSSPTVGYITSTSTTVSSFFGGLTINGILNAPNFNNIIASSTQYIENVGKIIATSTISTPALTVNGVSITGAASRYTFATTTDIAVTAGYATSTPITIPAGVMTASSTIDIYASIQCAAGTVANCGWYVSNAAGVPFINENNALTPPTSGTVKASIHIQILPNNSTSAQNTIDYSSMWQTQGSTQNLDPLQAESSSNINLSNAFSIYFVIQSQNGNSTATLKNLSYIVNP